MLQDSGKSFVLLYVTGVASFRRARHGFLSYQSRNMKSSNELLLPLLILIPSKPLWTTRETRPHPACSGKAFDTLERRSNKTSSRMRYGIAGDTERCYWPVTAPCAIAFTERIPPCRACGRRTRSHHTAVDIFHRFEEGATREEPGT